MTIQLKVLDAGYVTRVPGGTLHYPGGEDCEPAGWTTRLVLDPLGPAPQDLPAAPAPLPSYCECYLCATAGAL